MDLNNVRRAYDRVAAKYHQTFKDELDAKPFDRRWLGDFAALFPGAELIVEVGCGDGHVAALLAGLGLRIEGTDLSQEMVRVAQASYPGLDFRVADVMHLPFDDASISGVVAFYAIVNLTSDDCMRAFEEVARVLSPGGYLTLAFHLGDERVRAENWLETDATLDFYLHPRKRVQGQLEGSGLGVVRAVTRGPYAQEIEAQTERCYVLARRRGPDV